MIATFPLQEMFPHHPKYPKNGLRYIQIAYILSQSFTTSFFTGLPESTVTLIENHPKAMIALLVALTSLAAIRIYHAVVHPTPGHAVAAYYDSVTEQVRHAASHVKKGASVVVLVFDAEMRSQNNEPLKRMIKALKEENLSIRHVERLIMDTSRGWSETMPGFPYEAYVRVALEYPKADAILSLCSAPYPDPALEKTDVSSLPPLLLMRAVPWSPGLSRLVEGGLVAMAVVNKDPDLEDDMAPEGAAFDQTFEILTSADFKMP
jgi:hypothetical protein